MASAWVFDNIEVRPAERRLLRAGVPQALGGRAFDLLLALIGAWLVELASVVQPDAVAHAVAGALGFPQRAGKTTEQALVEALRRRHLPLVLGNCEHLIDEVAALVHCLLDAAMQGKALMSHLELTARQFSTDIREADLRSAARRGAAMAPHERRGEVLSKDDLMRQAWPGLVVEGNKPTAHI